MSITIEQQIACVRRELAMRKNVYPKWVTVGRMKQEASDKEIAALQAVHDTLIGFKWRFDMENCPGESGKAIHNWPSFYCVDEATIVVYASDEGEAIALLRAKLDHSLRQWQPYAWMPISAPPVRP